MARLADATGPAAWADKVFRDYASFLASRIAPVARASKTRIFVAGVLPPVVEDPCKQRPHHSRLSCQFAPKVC